MSDCIVKPQRHDPLAGRARTLRMSSTVARLPFLDQADLPLEQQSILEGRPINLGRVLAHSPNARRDIHALAKYIRLQSRLDPRLRELAIIRVSIGDWNRSYR